jgi:hypothetical protein
MLMRNSSLPEAGKGSPTRFAAGDTIWVVSGAQASRAANVECHVERERLINVRNSDALAILTDDLHMHPVLLVGSGPWHGDLGRGVEGVAVGERANVDR